jgi:hypothetical protein
VFNVAHAGRVTASRYFVAWQRLLAHAKATGCSNRQNVFSTFSK